MQANWFVLSGWQIGTDEQGNQVEHRQDWLARPSAPELEEEQEERLTEQAARVKLHGVKAMR
jgi:hypothetical protein